MPLRMQCDAVGEDAEGESLGGGKGFLLGLAVGEDAGKIEDFGNPAAVVFALRFDGVLFLRHALELV